MKTIYWNELSDSEIKKIESEWSNSEWNKNAIKQSNEKLERNGYTIFRVLEIVSSFFVMLSIIRLFIIILTNSLDDYEMKVLYPLCISSTCFFLFGIMANYLRKKYQTKYLDDEYKKWLLKYHNIIK